MKINDINFDFFLYSEDRINQDNAVGINEVEPNNCGVSFRSKGKIFVNKEISEDQQFVTIVHEMTHCYIWAYGLAQVGWNEEIVCDFIAAHADSIIRDSVNVYNNLFKGRRK